MSRCHVAPRVIETEIELFLDNFKYVTSLLQSEFSVLDCRTSPQSSYDPVLLSPNDNNRLSWPDDTVAPFNQQSRSQDHFQDTFTLTSISIHKCKLLTYLVKDIPKVMLSCSLWTSICILTSQTFLLTYLIKDVLKVMLIDFHLDLNLNSQT